MQGRRSDEARYLFWRTFDMITASILKKKNKPHILLHVKRLKRLEQPKKMIYEWGTYQRSNFSNLELHRQENAASQHLHPTARVKPFREMLSGSTWTEKHLHLTFSIFSRTFALKRLHFVLREHEQTGNTTNKWFKHNVCRMHWNIQHKSDW